jgi:putative OPT family oligopeptide transporter
MQEISMDVSATADGAGVVESHAVPEITVKAVVLAIVLTIILCASNAYLALKLGQTVSASIPAAIIAMGALRFFRRHNVLENNIVQTAASAGEGVASTIAFVLPGLLIIGYWQYFKFWETVLITLTGGLLGVLFSVPLRRVMLNYPTLIFPEGTAIGNVLKASASGKFQMKSLIRGGVVGSVITLCQTGFKVLSESISLWSVKNNLLFGVTIGFSPALLAAGFIVGIQACIAILVGLVLAWGIGIPVYAHIYGLPNAASYYDMALAIRAEHIRYMGVGSMLLGGIWTMITLIRPIITSLSTSFRSLRDAGHSRSNVKMIRTERDIPMNVVCMGIGCLAIAAFFVFAHFFNMEGQPLSNTLRYGISGFAVVYLLVIGFLLASVCAYLTGLVGITNNPISGLILISSLLSALMLYLFLGQGLHSHAAMTKIAVSMVLIITVIVSTAVIISGENLQDLKAGRMVGATPWKQQVMLLIGVVVAAFVIAPVLELLFKAYGIGGVFPRPGMDPAQMLGAPQSALVTAVIQGVYGNSLPWLDLSIGIAIAAVGVVVDGCLKKRNLRLPILAIGIGIYLPPEVTTAVVIGGVLNYVCKRAMRRRAAPAVEKSFEGATLLACGIVAGAALMGVLLAIPFVLKQSSDALRLVPPSFTPVADVLGLGVLILFLVWIYQRTLAQSP